MKVLIVQTAFIGDVVLATPIIENLRDNFPNAIIDILVRKGNESLLDNNPHLRKVLVFNKKQQKYKNLISLIRQIRSQRYEYVINVQRFFTTGLITAFSKGKVKIGFDKNPLSLFFQKKVPHQIVAGQHEVDRNLTLIADMCTPRKRRPQLYPSSQDFEDVRREAKYLCIAPASVWFTKQFPIEGWVQLINELDDSIDILLLGAPGDKPLCEEIRKTSVKNNIETLAGKLTFLQSAALMKNAEMNFVNDSAPMHFASSVDAPVTVMYCSTVPEFGFGPLSEKSWVMQSSEPLACRPCGLHGKKECPEKHFLCGRISARQILRSNGMISSGQNLI